MYELTTKEYQVYAGYTDMIKPEKQKYYYPLGLGGEHGEMLEKIYNLKPDSKGEVIYDAVKEIGDCAWYCVRWMNAIDSTYLTDNNIIMNRICNEEVSFYQALHYAVVSVVRMGKCLDMTKKIIRDDNDIYTKEKEHELLDNIYSVIVALAYCSKALGYTMAETCEINLNKLASRKMRDALGGSGDNR